MSQLTGFDNIEDEKCVTKKFQVWTALDRFVLVAIGCTEGARSSVLWKFIAELL